ncbi:MAG: hypothetical protein DMG85_14050 [Acidobacteria bacterium]|nr:MAG: hypothetical protein DMG85_14050 [Acidobacteriota bacterium]
MPLLHRHYFAQALSPDGRTLAFLRVRTHCHHRGRGSSSCYPMAKSCSSRDTTRKMHPVFSPDGASIAYSVP